MRTIIILTVLGLILVAIFRSQAFKDEYLEYQKGRLIKELLEICDLETLSEAINRVDQSISDGEYHPSNIEDVKNAIRFEIMMIENDV